MKEKNFEPLKQFLLENDIKTEISELHIANINVSENNGFYLYNYNKNVLIPRDDEILMFCRGLVLNEHGLPYNFPFKRFFNAHEKECDKIDWESAEILEKLDGSMISVWYTGSEWEVTTRGSFYPNSDNLNFKEVFKRLFDSFDELLKGYSYMFELISKDNRIVTNYDKERVILIGARDLFEKEELNQYELDIVADNLDVYRPKRYNASNVDECRKLFEGIKDDEEGFVIVDKHFNRMKLKQESYLKMSRIINMKNQDLLDFVLGKTKLDADFDKMKEVEAKIREINNMVNRVIDYAHIIYKNLQHIKSQKEFASHAMKYKISSLLFSLRQGKQIYDLDIKYDRYVEYFDVIPYPKEKKLIVLRGIPGSGKSTWIKENNLSQYALSMDTIRLMLQAPDPYISQENNSKVWSMFSNMLEFRMQNGSFTILDNVHVRNQSIKDYQKLCDKYGYELEEKVFEIPLSEAIERNMIRGYKKVPADVIEKHFNQLNTNLYKP